MRLLAELARGAAETIRETLPSDEREAGVWVSGLAWAFVLHWAVLLWVTWGYCSSRGGCV
jgi:hypothetical protein